MILTGDQDVALKAIDRWLGDSSRWMFYLGGFAGTGKTALLHYFINHMDKTPICLAPTGKAASVLQKRLDNATVTTVHKALYVPATESTEKLERLIERLKEEPEFTERLKSEIKFEKERLAKLKPKFGANQSITITRDDLVIVDEASMVNNRMLDDFQALGCKVLFVGDPGQLPPVGDDGYFNTHAPDAMLQEVVRQAADNPIIRWSMKVRNGDSIPSSFTEGPITKMPMKGFEIEKFLPLNQILCGTNAMRRRLNRAVRRLVPFEEKMPMEGEQLICLKNGFKYEAMFVNGIQLAASGDARVNNIGEWVIDVLYEGQSIEELPFYSYPFEVHYNEKAEQEPYQMRKGLVELDWAYCITVHKSQGSEWPKVGLVDDELFAGDAKFRKRWLYTAITRAKEELLWLGS